jgi:hypothetical protein
LLHARSLFGRERRALPAQFDELTHLLSLRLETLSVARFDLAQLVALRVGQIETAEHAPLGHPATAARAIYPALPTHSPATTAATFDVVATLRRVRLRERRNRKQSRQPCD